MVPFNFSGCSGWLHPASHTRGVVLLGSFGFEDLCARRSMTVLGELLAEAGAPTLRFDWAGTGDALDIEANADRLDLWESNVHEAVDTLKTRCGVTEVVLVGLRLGAMLAARAAAARQDISRIAMIAPPLHGKAWRREMSTLGRIMAPAGSLDPGFAGLDCGGFRMGPEALAGISAFRWTDLPAQAAPQVDLFGAGPSAALDPIRDALEARGAVVSTDVFHGYDDMMCDPTASRTPLATLRHLTDLIAKDLPVAASNSAFSARPRLTGPGFTEESVLLAHPRLTGVLCAPAKAGQRREALIMLNAGAIPHTGWGRMHVDVARTLAQRGVASLRLDLPGLGDNAGPADPEVASLFAAKRRDEIGAGIDLLQARGFDAITVMGACSGAYQAFHAGIADPRIANLVLVNQLCFVWSNIYAIQLNAWQATKSRTMQAQLAAEPAGEETLSAARSLAQLLPFAKKIAKESLSALMSLQTMATHALGRENPVEAGFLALSSRGARVMLTYSEGDAGLLELERHMGPQGARAMALPGVEMTILPNADHMLTPAPARAEFTARLIDFMDRGCGELTNAADPALRDEALRDEARRA